MTSGIVIGAGGYWALNNARPGMLLTTLGQATRTSAAGLSDIRSMSAESARAQRALNYQDLDSIAQMRELPSSFARREALYAIAGRAGASQLRKLINEAERIPGEHERVQTLEVLLLREVELEPEAALHSALSMSRDNVSRLMPLLFGAWSQSDPDAAVAALKQLPALSLRQNAAHAILAANTHRGSNELHGLAAQLGLSGQLEDVLFFERSGSVLDDPQQAIAAALSLPTGGARHTELIKIAQAWARIAPEEAWEHAMQLEDAGARIVFQNTVAATWAKEHPDAAFARVVELPAGWQRDQLLHDVTGELADRDPRRAVEMLSGVDPEEVASLRVLIAAGWAHKDAAGAAQWIESLKFSAQGRPAFEIAKDYMAQQPEEALAWALRISRSPGRNLWSRMLGIMAEQNPDEALRIAQASESPAQRINGTSEVITTLAQHDPERAMAYLEKLPAGDYRNNALAAIGRKVSERSPDAALAWLDTLKDTQSRMIASQWMIPNLVGRDIDAAVALVDRVPKDLRARWVMTIAGVYADADPEKGIQWVGRLRDDPLYSRAVTQLAASLAARNPESALDLVERLDAKARDPALANIIMTAVSSSPETATRWLDKISDPVQRDQATVNLASSWSQYDPAASRKWVLSLQPTPARDSMLAELTSFTIESVEDTLSLIDQIQRPERRMDAVMNAAMNMRTVDPEGARTLLRRRPLDPAHQQMYDTQQLRGKMYGRW
jgi:hypothetical protein